MTISTTTTYTSRKSNILIFIDVYLPINSFSFSFNSSFIDSFSFYFSYQADYLHLLLSKVDFLFTDFVSTELASLLLKQQQIEQFDDNYSILLPLLTMDIPYPSYTILSKNVAGVVAISSSSAFASTFHSLDDICDYLSLSTNIFPVSAFKLSFCAGSITSLTSSLSQLHQLIGCVDNQTDSNFFEVILNLKRIFIEWNVSPEECIVGVIKGKYNIALIASGKMEEMQYSNFTFYNQLNNTNTYSLQQFKISSMSILSIRRLFLPSSSSELTDQKDYPYVVSTSLFPKFILSVRSTVDFTKQLILSSILLSASVRADLCDSLSSYSLHDKDSFSICNSLLSAFPFSGKIRYKVVDSILFNDQNQFVKDFHLLGQGSCPLGWGRMLNSKGILECRICNDKEISYINELGVQVCYLCPPNTYSLKTTNTAQCLSNISLIFPSTLVQSTNLILFIVIPITAVIILFIFYKYILPPIYQYIWPPAIMISYSHKDLDFAIKLEKNLTLIGFKVWMDTEIIPGDDWRANIAKAIEKSLAVVFIMSPTSVKSKYCKEEIYYALNIKVPIFPIVYQDSWSALSKGIKLVLQRIQWIRFDKMEFEAALIKLVDRLRLKIQLNTINLKQNLNQGHDSDSSDIQKDHILRSLRKKNTIRFSNAKIFPKEEQVKDKSNDENHTNNIVSNASLNPSVNSIDVYICYDHLSKQDIEIMRKIKIFLESHSLDVYEAKRTFIPNSQDINDNNNIIHVISPCLISPSPSLSPYPIMKRRNSIKNPFSEHPEIDPSRFKSNILNVNNLVDSPSSSIIPSVNDFNNLPPLSFLNNQHNEKKEMEVDFFESNAIQIEAAECLIFIVSHSSLKSPDCADEIHYAYELNKPMIQIRSESFNNILLSGSMGMMLQTIPSIIITNHDQITPKQSIYMDLLVFVSTVKAIAIREKSSKEIEQQLMKKIPNLAALSSLPSVAPATPLPFLRVKSNSLSYNKKLSIFINQFKSSNNENEDYSSSINSGKIK